MFLNQKSLFLKFTEWALYAFFITFPFINYSYYLYTGTTTRAINLIGVVSILAIIFGFWLFKTKNSVSIFRSPIWLALILYFVSIFVSALNGFNFNVSFWSNVTRMTGLWYLLNLGFLVAFISASLQNTLWQKRIIKGVVYSTALYSIFALLSVEGLGWVFKNYISDGFTLGNSTFAGMYLFGAFILSIYYLYTNQKRKWWMYLLPLSLVINPTILNTKVLLGDFSSGFLGEARASAIVVFLSIISILVAWVISKIKEAKVKKRIIIGIFSLFFLAITFTGYSLLSPDGYVRKFYLSQATSARPLVWEVSNKVISDRPVFGWGIDNFERVFEAYYDNRLLQDEYGNEAWFDRAHNVFVDQVIDNGYVGLVTYMLIYIVLGLCLLSVVLGSRSKENRVLATLLLIYFGLHLLELQTAFDTSVSFAMLGLLMAFSIHLYHDTKTESKRDTNEIVINSYAKYPLGILIIGFFSWTFFVGLVPFIKTQNANGYMRVIGSSEKRLERYDELFGSKVDLPAFLWRTSTDLQRGIGENPQVLADSKKVESLNREFEYLANKYKDYLSQNPKDFRSHLNLADILIYQKLFEVDKLEEAQRVLDEAVKLVPQSPQAYWMKAVAYVYTRQFDLARTWANKAIELNPKIKESHEVLKYVNESVKTFPDIDLYFFGQI